MESVQEIGTCEVLACDESFFTALLAADHELLGTILAGDFLIIDVLSGQVGHREELLGAISSGQLRFAEVTRQPEERWIRLRDSAAVVAGRRHHRTRRAVAHRGACRGGQRPCRRCDSPSDGRHTTDLLG